MTLSDFAKIHGPVAAAVRLVQWLAEQVDDDGGLVLAVPPEQAHAICAVAADLEDLLQPGGRT